MVEYWGDYCHKQPGYSHHEHCRNFAACPRCGKANPQSNRSSSTTLIRSQTPASLSFRSSSALLTVSSAHRQDAITRNRSQQPTRPNAGAPQHHVRARTQPTSSTTPTVPPPPSEPPFININGTILVQTETGKWKIEGKTAIHIKIDFILIIVFIGSMYIKLQRTAGPFNNTQEFLDYIANKFSILKNIRERPDVNREGKLAYDKQPSTHVPMVTEDDLWEEGTTVEIIELFPTETVRGETRHVMYFAFWYQDPDSIMEDSHDIDVSLEGEEEDSDQSKGKRRARAESIPGPGTKARRLRMFSFTDDDNNDSDHDDDTRDQDDFDFGNDLDDDQVSLESLNTLICQAEERRTNEAVQSIGEFSGHGGGNDPTLRHPVGALSLSRGTPSQPAHTKPSKVTSSRMLPPAKKPPQASSTAGSRHSIKRDKADLLLRERQPLSMPPAIFRKAATTFPETTIWPSTIDRSSTPLATKSSGMRDFFTPCYGTLHWQRKYGVDSNTISSHGNGFVSGNVIEIDESDTDSQEETHVQVPNSSNRSTTTLVAQSLDPKPESSSAAAAREPEHSKTRQKSQKVIQKARVEDIHDEASQHSQAQRRETSNSQRYLSTERTNVPIDNDYEDPPARNTRYSRRKGKRRG